MTDKPEKKITRRGTVIRAILTSVLFFAVALIITAMLWCMDVWRDITVDEIIFHLSAPLEGTSSDVINGFLLRSLMPAVIAAALFCSVRLFLGLRSFGPSGSAGSSGSSGRADRIVNLVCWVMAGVILILSSVQFCLRYGVVRYIASQTMNSDFIANNYVSPDDVNLTFPEKKRNLIYIYLESMEMTYSDKADGGAFDENVIPELTDIALGNECFNGDSGTLDGALVTTGTDYTMAALVAQTAGIPIKDGIGNAAASYADSFYPGARVLGDVLADAGYNQTFMCGSVAYFGGRELYFKGHGNYKIFDYKYAENNDYIPKGYNVWWGFEDEKLFGFAKDEITAMAAEDRPFNFTMLTADTHFEDGYVCDLCRDDFDDQYSNVMACSSRQVSAFLDWIREQPFYDNTTIVISGDHTTMDSDYLDSIDTDYQRRTYVAVINPAAESDNDERREYCTLDMFPTTLAAMGVDIQGDRLGLGVNLFSDKKTLMEQYGYDYVDTELAKKSSFYQTIGAFDTLTADILKHLKYLNLTADLDADNTLAIDFWGIENGTLEIASARGEFYKQDGTLVASAVFTIDAAKDYKGEFDLSSLGFRDIYTGNMKLYATDTDGVEHVIYDNDDNTSVLSYSDISSYIDMLANLDDVTVMIAGKDECSTNLTPAIRAEFNKLGLSCPLYDHTNYSYYAVATDGEQPIEQASPQMLQTSGELEDGTGYEITSAGLHCGNVASIEIGDNDYAINTRGLNIVVYDNDAHRVVDRRVYDLYGQSVTSYMDDDSVDVTYDYDSEAQTLDVLITGTSDVILKNRNLYVYMYIWSANGPAEVTRKVFTEGTDDNGWTCFKIDDLDVSGYDPDTFGMMIFLKSQDTGFIDYKTKMVVDLNGEG